MSGDYQPTTADPRADSESAAGRVAVPIWLIVLLAVLLYAGLIELDKHGGGFNEQVYQPYVSFAQVDDLQPKIIGPDVKKGKIIFNQYCSACHQATGLGTPGQFPPLAGSEWVLAPNPNRMLRIVLNGLTGPVDVKGLHFTGSTPMAAWKTVIPKDEDFAAVISFVRGNKEWGNNAPPVTAEQVKAVRDLLKDRPDTQAFTVEELMKIPDTK